MTWARARVVLAAALGLLVALNVLVYTLYRSEVQAVRSTLDDRLVALGTTAAKWLTAGGDADRALPVLVAENRLEDAYIVDAGLSVVSGVRTKPGPINLLRVDDERFADAMAGTPSSGLGYSVANVEVEVAYFPVGTNRVLVLEAGAEYHEPAAHLAATYALAVVLTILLAAVCVTGLVLALRALERTRIAHGRAERLAAVGQMAAMVAHEVRNPLGILRGQVELARERLGDKAPERERERFAEMLDEIARLTDLTEDFLRLASDVPLDVGDVDLKALADAVANDVRASDKRAVVEVSSADGIAPVQGDMTRLRQALRNLALNAVQVGAQIVRIEITAEAKQARVSVVDDGPGVPVAMADKLFDPFVTGRTGGSGLGLVVARRAVERHGGTLVLESRPGSPGARFSIYLPRSGWRGS